MCDIDTGRRQTALGLSFLIVLNWGLQCSSHIDSQTVKSLLAMQETWVQSLGREDPLEADMATYSSILAWKIPRTEENGGLQSIGLHRVGND